MAVLKEFSLLRTVCDACGGNYMAIESTDDPTKVQLLCSCRAVRPMSRQSPVIRQALEDSE